MPPPGGILATVNRLLDANAFTTGGWVKHNSEELNPLNPGTWAPQFSIIAGVPGAGIFALFMWVDQPPFTGPLTKGNWVRWCSMDRVITAAEIFADTGLNVVAGQYIGFRVRSNFTLRTPIWFLPNTTWGIAVEIEGEQLSRFETFQALFDLWTIPPDPGNNRQDNYILAQMPTSGPLEITVRMLAIEMAPSGNLICTFPEWEYAVYEPEPVPIPPSPPEPIVLTPCSIADILAIAQNETGYRWDSKLEPARHLSKYAKQLLSRCMASWYGNEIADENFLIFDLGSQGSGWGHNWGFNWGGGVIPGVVHLNFPLPNVEAIWHVEAQRIGNNYFEPVAVVKPDDMEVEVGPRVLIRDRRIELLDFAADWLQVFDTLRIRATDVHPASAATASEWSIPLAPNAHIGPLFCRACELEMSKFLAAQKKDTLQVVHFKKALDDVTASLMSQSRSQGWIETSRGSRR